MNKVSLERRGRNLFPRLLGLIFPVRKRKPESVCASFQKGEIRKILIIRPHQGLGDLLLATPVFRALHQSYPSVQIHFLADTYNQIAIRDNPSLHKVWIWDKKAMRSPRRLFAFLGELQAERFDVAVPLFSHVPSFTSFLLARASGARTVWSYSTKPFYDGADWSRTLAHVELPNRPETDPEWVKFADLFRPFGIDPSCEPEFTVSTQDQQWARQKWLSFGLPETQPKVALFLGGNPARPERLWPLSRWVELVLRLHQEKRVSLMLIIPPGGLLSGSGAAERGLYDELAPHFKAPPPVFSDPDLRRVAAFLQGADLFVCPDGGLFHIAVGSRVRTLGLFFPTDPARWAPPLPWVQTLRPSDDQPASLPADTVYRKIMEIVSENIRESVDGLCSRN